MNHKKLKLTTKYLILICSVMVFVNLVMGLMLVRQSKQAMTALINDRMEDISNTAAAALDGDMLEKITAQDVGSDEYNEILNTLRLFQENADLEYIYTIQDMGNDEFAFIIDPDPVSPGAFGDPVVTTEALITASKGTAAIDEKPFQDVWGKHYSSYSPVFDSKGNVAGIVGADFNADRVDAQLRRQNMTILFISLAAVIIAAVIVSVITGRILDRFRKLYEELSSLTEDLENLNRDIVSNPDYQGLVEDTQEIVKEVTASELEPDIAEDAIGALSDKLKSMHTEMNQYLSIVHKQAYADPMTGLGNKTAYHNMIKVINSRIPDGTAEYTIILIEIDDLKKITADHGHEFSDMIICDVASILKKLLGAGSLYKMRDDSFIYVANRNMTLNQIDEIFYAIDLEIGEYNKGHDGPDISVSKGAAVYRTAIDMEFKDTLRRADERLRKIILDE